MLTVGSQGLYEWLVTDQPFDVLQICSEVVLGKYVAITSIDSARSCLRTRRERLVGRVEGRLRIARESKALIVYRVPDGMNGTFSPALRTLAQAILERMFLKCREDPDR